MALVGVVGVAVAVVCGLWIASGDHDPGTEPWVMLGAALAAGVAGFATARGCRVVVADGEVRDVVAWRTVHRVPCDRVEAVRVRKGAWRVFEMELADGQRRVVLGTGPVQFPANLLPDARGRDMAAIDAMLGEAPAYRQQGPGRGRRS
jgi:hypothetical protein